MLKVVQANSRKAGISDTEKSLNIPILAKVSKKTDHDATDYWCKKLISSSYFIQYKSI
jgi:hypothetical protein